MSTVILYLKYKIEYYEMICNAAVDINNIGSFDISDKLFEEAHCKLIYFSDILLKVLQLKVA